jgi:hypothetical protein
VIAKHVNLNDGQIVTWEEIETRLDDAAAKYGKIHPEFFSTHGGLAREAELKDRRWKIYGRMYEAKQIEGMTLGSLSPRSSQRYDRIRTSADLVPNPVTKLSATIVGTDDKPLEDAEVFLLPHSDEIGAVYLQDGRNRNPLEEHLIRTNDAGEFVISPEADEVFITVAHPAGFFITSLDNVKSGQIIKLSPWARMRGSRPAEGDDAKQSVNFVCHPIVGVSFNIYETPISEDGSFDQPFLPPGKIFVQRSLSTGNGGLSFPVSEWILIPGESEAIELGPIPAHQKKKAEERRIK